jgi:hypothetical protein
MTKQRVVLPKEGNAGDPRETDSCREQAHERPAQSCYQDRFHASHHRILVRDAGMRQRQNADFRLNFVVVSEAGLEPATVSLEG